ncbi:hypothetical protein J14TS2_17260 [Bacillus sp. J14TS2]|uniref:phage head-tail connector protein n=1 Tax=Bacillus sp. J14TS2 TaxID=2807188 RepID=UPI001B19A880|nr:phage head-tail connector protein [Bacillus sp. J14TS2]GIN71251.1 hypothetical protein J14TS2_17260 [Bacillus sp. J14TS2]
MEELLKSLKDRLQITWDEEDIDLKSIISRSKSYLSELTGATFDFDEEKWPKELLIERCRYVYNNAADEFEENFAHELSRLILLAALGKVGKLNEGLSRDV